MHIVFKTIPCLAKELSGDSLLSTLRILVQFWYFAFSRKFLGFSKDFPVRVSYNNQIITFYLRYVMDLAVLREVFIDKEYEWCPVLDPKIIIDLGAHFGDTALYYHARFPSAKIIAVEPSPENYERLVKHTRDVSNIIPVQAAAGSSDGEINLNLMASTLGHSVIDRGDADNSVTVPQLSLATLFKEQGIVKADLIKFDIEGAEFDVLKDLKLSEFSRSLIGEMHFDLSDTYDLEGSKLIFEDFEVEFEQLINKQRYIVKAVLGK